MERSIIKVWREKESGKEWSKKFYAKEELKWLEVNVRLWPRGFLCSVGKWVRWECYGKEMEKNGEGNQVSLEERKVEQWISPGEVKEMIKMVEVEMSIIIGHINGLGCKTQESDWEEVRTQLVRMRMMVGLACQVMGRRVRGLKGKINVLKALRKWFQGNDLNLFWNELMGRNKYEEWMQVKGIMNDKDNISKRGVGLLFVIYLGLVKLKSFEELVEHIREVLQMKAEEILAYFKQWDKEAVMDLINEGFDPELVFTMIHLQDVYWQKSKEELRKMLNQWKRAQEEKAIEAEEEIDGKETRLLEERIKEMEEFLIRELVLD